MSEPAADAGLLSSDAPVVNLGDARRAARELYGLDAVATPLAGERDANFLLTAENRPRWMMKFINPAESPAESDFQEALLRHVAGRDPHLPVPDLIERSHGGKGPFCSVKGRPLRVRLVTWLPGTPLHQVTASPVALGSLGRGLAALDLALAGFHHPAARRTLLWNSSDPGRVRPYWAEIQEPAQRRLLGEILDQFEERMPQRLGMVRHQVIHNDFNPHNVLLDASASVLAGIIDFGDALYAPLVNELATALAYQVSDTDDVLARMPPFVAGYHQVLPLTDEEIQLLPMLIASRLALSVIITQWRARRYPANRAYILRHRARAWDGVQKLWLLGPDEIADRLGAARFI
ncbi:phosphotransferase [Sodalis ligni]|uniref:Hydroxylysine kinase n=1 Tax=Sodalis ligni TaxID=2697027 RepID=A0A4R1NDR2_9GAMM|nr:phosphotransferase [Sodalis ligni]TCL02746.1 Ser/Thr protein kinase RdoA (MazF antagonist) [Sodalis ligni]